MVVVVVVVVSFCGGEEDEKGKQPDSNVDAKINTLSFLSIDVFPPSVIHYLAFKGQCCISSGLSALLC